MCVMLLLFFTGHTASRRIQRKVSEAAKDMGLATACVLFSALLDHKCRGVLLVPA